MTKEAQEQTQFFKDCASIKGCEFMFHVPNGGSRNLIEAVNLKKQGVRAGVPDIFLPVARGKYHGLFIELKVGDGKPTKEQKRYIKYLNEEGYAAVVCYGRETAVRTVLKYLNLT